MLVKSSSNPIYYLLNLKLFDVVYSGSDWSGTYTYSKSADETVPSSEIVMFRDSSELITAALTVTPKYLGD